MAATAATLWAPQLGDEHRGHPTGATSAPPADELDTLSVLRRDSTDADRGAPSTYALKLFDRSVHGVRLDYVRLLGTQADGGGYVLVPVESYHRPDETGSVSNALCLFAQLRGGGGVGCFSLRQIRQGHAVMGADIPSDTTHTSAAPAPTATSKIHTDPNGSHYRSAPAPLDTGQGRQQFGLVPDGVARVRAGQGPHATGADVHNNFFALTLPQSRSGIVPDIHWYDAAGKEIPHPAD